mgnify:CR=1 FL=1
MDQYTTPEEVPGDRGGTGPSEDVTPLPTGTEAILFAIRESIEAVEQKVEEVRVDVSLLSHDLRKVADRVTEAETRIFTVED